MMILSHDKISPTKKRLHTHQTVSVELVGNWQEIVQLDSVQFLPIIHDINLLEWSMTVCDITSYVVNPPTVSHCYLWKS